MNNQIFIASLLILSVSCKSDESNLTKTEPINMKSSIEVADYANDSSIERQTKTFLLALNNAGGKPMETLTPQEARHVLEGAQASAPVDTAGIESYDRIIIVDTLAIKLTIVRPAGVTGKIPGFMFLHGGGWVLGDFPTHKRFIRDLVVNSGAAAVYVDYSRSPEAKYPIALTESYAATKWVAENGADLNIDGKRLAVVGNSVGGNLAAAVALMAKDKGGPTLKLQVLFWPVTDANFNTFSYNKYATDRFLTRNMMKWFWDSYIPLEKRNEIYAAPLTATIQQLKGLPPALVQTAENDVLRDEGEAYARKMNEAGVDVTLVRYQGMIHDYGLLNPLANIPAVKSALNSAASELKKFLK